MIPASSMVPRLNGKDSRWLTLEACPEFLQGNCPRAEEECKNAHPPSHVEIQNGRVTCCYDSIKVSTVCQLQCICNFVNFLSDLMTPTIAL